MFDGLQTRLTKIFDRLRGQQTLTDEHVQLALREIRVALLEADVALSVVKNFVDEVRQKAVGQEIYRAISPGQMVVKIVHDHLVALLGTQAEPLNLHTKPPAVILMAGLQGSGKTTTAAKLARLLQDEGKRVMMASLDVYRPAAQTQLQILAEQVGVDALPIVEKQQPLDITHRALDAARKGLYDVLILDTAGRLHVDAHLMDEIAAVHKLATPIETLFVADAMTGQDAVNSAQIFAQRLTLTGVILTRIDGDARGGAALSMRQVTGCPIKYFGTGEKLDQIEVFHPDRIADRILGMGDIVSLVEKAAQTIDQEAAEKTMERMQRGVFTLDDLMTQLKQMGKMGGIGGLMGYLPGIAQIKDKIQEAGIDDRMIKRQIALIQAMTKAERRTPSILNASRRRRIAAGAGQAVSDLNRLLKQYEQMHTMMKRMGRLGQKGLMRHGLRGLFGQSRIPIICYFVAAPLVYV